MEIRGNVDTRIDLVRSGAVDAAILAVAGIERLDRLEDIARILPISSFLPAPAQGAVAVVSRAGDRALATALRAIDHPATRARILAERGFASALGGDCRVPLGALASLRDGSLSLVAEVLTVDGRTRLRARRRGVPARAELLGKGLGKEMLDRGALELWTSVHR